MSGAYLLLETRVLQQKSNIICHIKLTSNSLVKKFKAQYKFVHAITPLKEDKKIVTDIKPSTGSLTSLVNASFNKKSYSIHHILVKSIYKM